MRTDVKVGIALGAIVLIIAGSYYGSSSEPDIELAEPSASIHESNTQTLRQLLEPRGKPEVSSTNNDRHAESQAKPAVPPPQKTIEPQKQTPRTSAEQPRTAEPAVSLLERALRQSKQLPAQQPQERTVSPWRARPAEDRSAVADKSDPVEAMQPRRQGSRNEARNPRGRGLASRSQSRPERSQTPQSLPPKPPAPTAKHVILPGDSFAALAEKYYGSQRYTEFLMNANPAVEPRRMTVGSIVTIPPLFQGQPSGARGTSAGRTAERPYEVREGDSLYAIAQAQLGSGDRWPEIYQLNRAAIGASPSSLDVGLILRMPRR